jgi:hypothetical protein
VRKKERGEERKRVREMTETTFGILFKMDLAKFAIDPIRRGLRFVMKR